MMALVFHSYVLFLLATALLAPTARALSVRNTESDISTTKGGILIKNGKQTSCELGVIDSTAAFVAAPCLDFVGSTVNQTTIYEAYLDDGIDNTPVKYTVSSITVHPEYNSTININPIAILQFNQDSSESWSNSIAINRNSSWGDVLFISRGLTDVDSMQWRTPLTTTNGYSSQADCEADTRVFEFNQNDLICSNATTYSPFTYLTGCAIPYGSVDAYIDDKLYIAGIYAFTVISVASYTCTLRDFQDSMYVLFADYISFASKVLGRSVGYYPNSNGIAPQSNSGYSMATPDYLYTFRLVMDGDLYTNQTNSLQDGSNSSDSDSIDQSQDSSNSDGGSSQTSDANSDSDASKQPDIGSGNGRDASSNKATIIGVVCGVLGGIFLTCVVLLLYRKWKQTHNNIYKNKESHVDMQTMLVVDGDNYSMPASIRMRPEQPPKPIIQPPVGNISERDNFELFEYDLPPLYEPNASSPASTAPANQQHQQYQHNNHP